MEAPKYLCLILLLLVQAVRSQEPELPICPESQSLLPHPNCAYYYQCLNYIPILRNCSEGLYFNPRVRACDHPTNVPECEGGTRPPPWFPSSTENFSYETVSLPTETTPGVTDSTAEDPSTTWRTTEEPSTTEDRPTTTTTTRTTTPEPTFPTEAPFCPPTGVHNFPYPGNCTLYIRCFDGFEQILSCAPLIFDKIDLVCKPEGEAVCDEEFPVRCPPLGYEALPHSSNCSKYYECINGNAYESECAANTYFDETPDLLRCNQAEFALCNSECHPTGLEFLPIRVRGCKWYKICIDGHSANLECGAEQVYSPIESKCVGDDEYNCPYLLSS